MNGRFVVAMVRRETRASRRRFALYGGCMALGIAALVGLHGLRATVGGAVEAQARRLLGADLRLASRAPLDAATESLVAAFNKLEGSADARVTRFGSMALATRSERTRLVDVQAVSGGFPFYGNVRTEPPGLWAELQNADRAALVDRSLLIQLDARVGDALALGRARFRIAGAIARAPGTYGLRTEVAPRVYIARRYVEETQLVQRGSLVDHLVYLRAAEAPLRRWLDTHRKTLESARVRVQTVSGYQEDLTESFGALTRYLGLVGLAALALGGVGIASGVRAFVREKLDTVAVLRALGTGSRDVLAIYTLLAMALGLVAGLVGSALGVAFQWLLPTLLGGVLPVEVEVSVEPTAVATGVGLGLWLTLLFAAGPLLDLGRVPPLRALRRDFAAERMSRGGRLALICALAASLLAAALWQAPSPAIGLAFAAGLGGALAVLAATATAVATALRRHPPSGAPFWLRQGVANLFRPRNHTVATVLAVGFGLFLVSTLQLVRENVLRQVALDTRADRPNLVLFDVQRDQRGALETFVTDRGATIVERAPIVSARIAQIAGRDVSVPLGEDETDRDLRWALRREYQTSYHAELRETERISAGHWWTSEDLATAEPAAVSVETEIAEILGIEPGDRIGWDVQGVRVESVVRSLRDVDWGRLATNFFVVFAPIALEQAPQSVVLLLHMADPEARAVLQRDLVGDFPNVSALDATVILRALDAMLREVGLAVRILALFTIATGLAILVAASTAARHERTREAILLRTLGASSRTVTRIVATEAVALGSIAAGVGSALALVAAWALVRFVFELPFAPPLGELAGLALATLCITGWLGAATGRPDRSRSPLAALREAELSGAG